MKPRFERIPDIEAEGVSIDGYEATDITVIALQEDRAVVVCLVKKDVSTVYATLSPEMAKELAAEIFRASGLSELGN